MNLETILNPFSLMALLPLILLFILLFLYLVEGQSRGSRRLEIEERRWARTQASRRAR